MVVRKYTLTTTHLDTSTTDRLAKLRLKAMQVQAFGLVLLINCRLYLETEELRRREKTRNFNLLIQAIYANH